MISLATLIKDSGKFLQQTGYSLVRNNSSRIAGRLRRWALGTTCQIDTAVSITNAKNFRAKPGAALSHGCHIGNKNGKISLGRNSHLGSYCHVNVVKGNVTIGDDVAIGPGTCLISHSNHYVVGEDIATSKITNDIFIHDHVFVGANVAILPGSVIESHVVVGAGSVVKGRLESHGIYVGAPCRRLRDIEPEDSSVVSPKNA